MRTHPSSTRTAIAALVLVVGAVSLCVATEVPFLSGHVIDNAGLLNSETSSELEAMLRQHEDSTSNQVVVLTVNSLEGDDIETFSIHVVETWKLGRKGKDNGVLLLVAKDERKVRIEVGRGLEGDLTDLTCGRIIRHDIVPLFKEGNYDGGIRAGVESILAAIQGSYVADDEQEADSEPGGELWFSVIFMGFFLVIISPFTFAALVSKGFSSWFLYAFLIPFWAAFPMVALGGVAGGTLLACYLIGFPIAKYIMAKTPGGKAWAEKISKVVGKGGSSGGGWSSGGWSSGGSSSGGSSFSGGGGSFSGGGSSGSW
jgi:uncharacterized protein